jgi:hypothetical protein
MESAGKNDWLVSQSLERSLDIISAINRVSIHSKLRLEGVEDTTSPGELESARNALTTFLGTLSELIHKAEESEDKIAFGADPRLSSLARRFLNHPIQDIRPAGYRAEDLKELKALLEEGEAVNNELLVARLARLRAVLEQHAQADAAIVFNEV